MPAICSSLEGEVVWSNWCYGLRTTPHDGLQLRDELADHDSSTRFKVRIVEPRALGALNFGCGINKRLLCAESPHYVEHYLGLSAIGHQKEPTKNAVDSEVALFRR